MEAFTNLWRNFKQRPDQWFFYGFLLTFPLSIRKIVYFVPIEGRFNEFASVSIYLSDIFIIITISLWFIILCYNYNTLSSSTKLTPSSILKNLASHRIAFILPVIIISYSFLSVSWSIDQYVAAFRSTKLLEFYLLSLYIYKNNVPRGTFKEKSFDFNFYKRTLQIMALSGLIHSFIAIFQFVKQQSLGLYVLGESIVSSNALNVAKIVFDHDKIMRAYGLFPHPNILGGYLLMTIICTVALLKIDRLSKKLSLGKECSTWNTSREEKLIKNVPRGTYNYIKTIITMFHVEHLTLPNKYFDQEPGQRLDLRRSFSAPFFALFEAIFALFQIIAIIWRFLARGFLTSPSVFLKILVSILLYLKYVPRGTYTFTRDIRSLFHVEHSPKGVGIPRTDLARVDRGLLKSYFIALFKAIFAPFQIIAIIWRFLARGFLISLSVFSKILVNILLYLKYVPRGTINYARGVVAMFHVEQLYQKKLSCNCSTWNNLRIKSLAPNVPRGTFGIHKNGPDMFHAEKNWFEKKSATFMFHVEHSLGEELGKKNGPSLVTTLGGSGLLKYYFIALFKAFLAPFQIIAIIWRFLARGFLTSLSTFLANMFHVEHIIKKIYNKRDGSTANHNEGQSGQFYAFFKTIILPVQVIAIILTFSKTAILGLLIFLFWLYLTNDSFYCIDRKILCAPPARISSFISLKKFILFLLILVASLNLLKPTLYSMLQRSVSDRLYMLNVSREIISEKGFFGIGIGQYVSALRNQPGVSDWQFAPVHNIPLLVWSELGVLMLSLIIYILWRFVLKPGTSKSSSMSIDYTNYLLMFFMTYLPAIFFDHYLWDIQQGLSIFFILLGIMFSLESASDSDLNAPANEN